MTQAEKIHYTNGNNGQCRTQKGKSTERVTTATTPSELGGTCAHSFTPSELGGTRAHSNSAKCKALVVEDVREACEYLRTIGFECDRITHAEVMAATGEQYLGKLLKGDYDLV